MATTHVQSTVNANGTNPVHAAYTSNVTAGNLLVVVAADFNATTALTILSDTQGIVWTPINNSLPIASTSWRAWWGIALSTGPETVNFNSSVSTFPIGFVAEYAGFGSSAFVDQVISALVASGTALPSLTFTQQNTSEVLFVYNALNGNASGITGAVFTNRITVPNLAFSDAILTSTGSKVFSGNQASSGVAESFGFSLSPTALTFSITGNAGVAGATVSWTGTASGSTTADGSGNYTIPNLANGSYTITPTLSGYTFSPTSSNQTVSGSNITGVNFTATPVSTSAYSVPDCRNYASFPNTSILTNGTKIYTGQTSSNPAVPGTDSRAAGAPVDSRISLNIPQNSRTPGTYGPGE